MLAELPKNSGGFGIRAARGVEGLAGDAQKIEPIGLACGHSFRDLGFTEEQKRHVGERAGIQKPFVMHVGDREAVQNLGRLVRAFAQLPVLVRNRFQLAFVGDLGQEAEQELERAATAAGLQPDDLRFTGEVSDDELVRLYNSCALLVDPSLSQRIGLSVFEAMSCGTPVIGSRTGSLPEPIGLDAALFDPASCEEISATNARSIDG